MTLQEETTLEIPGVQWPSRDELDCAREVQRRLLPRKAPGLETLEYAGCYLPARGIGGDYYDFIQLGLGRVAFALGDIAGKGVPGALMMASLQAILRIQSAHLANDLRRLLRSVNRIFCECTEMNCFASLFLGEYTDRGRTLRYANCGHNPPLVMRRDFTVERLEATATVIGAFSDWNCTIREVALARGDTLAFYTDGVTEAMNESGEEFGEERLLEFLNAHHDLRLPALVSETAQVVRRFSGHPLEDDLTLVIARSTAPV
jgi:serine phosphatase RsbU (regulator of sigma subunit)